jgi:predicted nucleotide-binding protein (sugar kinase/HSP70/actin superfamily)
MNEIDITLEKDSIMITWHISGCVECRHGMYCKLYRRL